MPPASTSAPPAPANSPVIALTLEQYAALCAEIAVIPGGAEAAFHRYGLMSLRERIATDTAWQERLRNNPAEHKAWAAHYERYHAHLSRQQKPR